MACLLHVHHGQYWDEVTKVQTGGSGIKANVELGRFLFQLFVQVVLVGYLGNEAAFFEQIKNVHFASLL